ncbi:MAG: DUF4115 domain-containing protein [Ignavibacteriae bacterium]|nr:DUF4115 domain-containing protein [Ignavibacteriota bacterium]
MNALLLFGEDLKKNRQEKQISLTQVAASTRIHVRFLEAIEDGRFSVLPKPYVRSFIREYAVATELNPEETLRKYDAAVQEENPAPAPVEQQPEHSDNAFSQKQQEKIVSFLRRLSVPFAGVIIVLVAVLSLANSGSTGTKSDGLKEISFDRAVQESEAAVAKLQPVVNRVLGATPSAPVDSLRLEMTTVDSLWLVVMIDDHRKEEYLFPPKSHRRWAAKEQFTLTLGNAGSATFRLNGKDLGFLGKPGAVIRNALITESTAPNL